MDNCIQRNGIIEIRVVDVLGEILLKVIRDNGDEKEDGLLKMEKIKMPDFAVWSSALENKFGRQRLVSCLLLLMLMIVHWLHVMD